MLLIAGAGSGEKHSIVASRKKVHKLIMRDLIRGSEKTTAQKLKPFKDAEDQISLEESSEANTAHKL